MHKFKVFGFILFLITGIIIGCGETQKSSAESESSAPESVVVDSLVNEMDASKEALKSATSEAENAINELLEAN